MFNLNDPNISYILFSPGNENQTITENHIQCEKLCSILYSKDYTIIPIQSYTENYKYDNSFLAIKGDVNNDELRMDSIYIIDEFNKPSSIVKYNGDANPHLIKSNGEESPLSIEAFSTNESKKYLYNGVSFSFKNEKRYFFPKRKEDIKNNMIVEYFNNNKWISKKVLDLDTEYENLYKLLIKYEKLRIEL